MEEEEFFRDILKNFLPHYDVYRENMEDLKEFDHLLNSLQEAQDIREQMRARKSNKKVMELDEILQAAYSRLQDVLNKNKETCETITEDFELWILRLEEEIRTIVPDAFPIPPAPSVVSKLIPETIQRTSRRVSSKLVRAMTKNTKYHDFMSMTRGQRRRYGNRILFILLAWALAVIGMFISIAFLTRDFALAHENLSVQVDRLPKSPKTLPAITICSDLQGVPSFENFPSEKYPGLPLFSVSLYHRGNRSVGLPKTLLTYPKTLSNDTGSPIESVVVSEESTSCRSEGFHIAREMDTLKTIGQAGSFGAVGNSESNCLHCFRVGVKIKETLVPYHPNTTAALMSPAVHVTISKSRLFGFCQSYYIRNSAYVEQLLATELFLHAKHLERKKILDFNGQDHSVLKRRLWLDNVPKRADFYCNVYFFSGYFYPTVSDAQISYKYTGLPEIWTKTGAGPYYTGYMWETDDPMQVGPDAKILSRDSYAFGGIRLFVEDPDRVNTSRPVSPKTQITLLDRSSASTVTMIRKVFLLDRVQYNVQSKIIDFSVFADRTVDLFHLGFDFDMFDLERVYTYSTMAWSEYLTDVFEYIGLFTGVCIFTLIVAPANRAKGD